MALALAAAAPAGAQRLRRLHVTALGMHADRAQVHVGEPFHVAIHVHVNERVRALDELVVPDVGTLQMLGDERRASAGAAGTDIVETITLQAAGSGRFAIAPAYLDAIDARTGRPSRFSSNGLSIVVSAPAAEDPLALGAAWRRTTSLLLGALAVVLGAALLLLLGRRFVRRERPVADVAAPAAAAPPPPPRTARDEVADALRTYRVTSSSGALARLRDALFAAATAPPGGTLRDALGATSDARLRAALSAAERAAFGPASGRDAAGRELIDAAEAWLR